MSDSKGKILKGLFWSYGERITAQVVTLVVSVILARMLSPDEYGIIALVTVFITLANIMVTDGFGNALIQKKDADQVDFSTIFWFSEGLSVIIYVILFFAAPLISAYYDIPILSPVIRVMAIRVPIAAINSIQRAQVSRRMEFKKFFFSTLFGTLVSGVVGVCMAYLGFGVWAIVGQYLTNSTIDTIVLFATSGWRPRVLFDSKRLSPLLSFGGKILCVSMMNSLYSNLRNLIIAKNYSSSDLAYSNKGQTFPSLISVNISSSLTSVIFPVISQIQDDKEKLLVLTRKVIQVGSFLMCPLLIGLAAVGNEFIRLLLTDKWLPSVPYMQIMCLVYLLQPIQQASIQSMKALGESGLYLRLEIYKKIFGLTILLIAVLFGHSVLLIVLSALVVEIVSTVINFPANKRLIHYKYKDQLLDIGIPLLMAGIMWIFIIVLNYSLSNLAISAVVMMIIDIILGATVYMGLAMVMKNDGFIMLIGMLKTIKKEKKKDGTERFFQW